MDLLARIGYEQGYRLVTNAFLQRYKTACLGTGVDAGDKEALQEMVKGLLKGMTTGLVDENVAERCAVEQAFEAAVYEPGSDLADPCDVFADVLRNLDSAFARAKTTRRARFATIKNVELVVEPSGRIWIGFVSPDDFASRAGGDSAVSALAAQYLHWYEEHFLTASEAVREWQSLHGIGEGEPLQLRIFDASVESDERGIEALVDITDLQIQDSPQHSLVDGDEEPVACCILMIETGFKTVGCVLGTYEKSGLLVKQRNLCAFVEEEQLDDYLMGMAESIAATEKLHVVMRGRMDLAFCETHRQVMCPARLEFDEDLVKRQRAFH